MAPPIVTLLVLATGTVLMVLADYGPKRHRLAFWTVVGSCVFFYFVR